MVSGDVSSRDQGFTGSPRSPTAKDGLLVAMSEIRLVERVGVAMTVGGAEAPGRDKVRWCHVEKGWQRKRTSG